MTDADILRLCITRVSRTKHASGSWQAYRACAEALTRPGDDWASAVIALNCSEAAVRIGLWLRTVTKETPC